MDRTADTAAGRGLCRTHVFDRVKRRLNARFVATVEATGYLLCALVGAATAYSMFAEADVLARAVVQLQPVSIPVAVERDAVVVERLVTTGSEVAAGQDLCRVVTDPVDRERALAERRLIAAVKSLESAGPDGAEVALHEARKALAALPRLHAVETLTAPVSGRVKFPSDAASDDGVPAGIPVAVVLREDVIEAAGPLEPAGAAVVAVGQTARLTLPPPSEVLTGRVTAVHGMPPTSVVLRFENVPAALRPLLADPVTAAAIPGSSTRAEIVVRRQSLFRHLFGGRG